MLTKEEMKIHQQALSLSRARERNDAEVVENLILLEQSQLYKKLDKRNMFTYAVDVLGHDEGFAYSAINIAGKSVQFPALRSAVGASRLSVGKASRIASCLTLENAAELVEFACVHTTDEINQEVARRNPKRERRDKVKWISRDLVEITTTMTRKDYEKLKRAESLEAPKKRGEVIGLCVEEYLFKHDPVQKAERSKKRESAVAQTFGNTEKRRVPLTALQKHTVFRRDQGRCTHRGLDGTRCNSERYIDLHHIIRVADGGMNDPANLTTLCSFHHDLVHQLSLAIDGQVSWIREPSVEYRNFS
jgi:5-methylcytosine-specific restriction endonuclease McrA